MTFTQSIKKIGQNTWQELSGHPHTLTRGVMAGVTMWAATQTITPEVNPFWQTLQIGGMFSLSYGANRKREDINQLRRVVYPKRETDHCDAKKAAAITTTFYAQAVVIGLTAQQLHSHNVLAKSGTAVALLTTAALMIGQMMPAISQDERDQIERADRDSDKRGMRL